MKKGKVIILGGNARSGKTTLSMQLVKKGFNRISFDNLYEVVEDVLKIKIDELPKSQQFKFFESFVDKAIEEAENYGINSVIDMYDFLPQDIEKLKNKNKVQCYFLAYPSCDTHQIKYNLKTYSKPSDWIAQVDEEYFNECVVRFDKRNKLLVKQCEKYNHRLIDTSYGENRNLILKELLNEILKKEYELTQKN